MKRIELAQMIDHTNLKAYASSSDIKMLCDQAVQYHFKMVAVNSCQSELCHALLAGSGVHTGAAIGFPLGQQTIAVKAFETEDALSHGADEIDYVINQTAVKNGDYDYVTSEMDTIVKICRQHQAIVKVILETCYLTDEEKIRICQIAARIKPDFVKTSTGFGSAGATVSDVRLMKSVVGESIGVKAAGGIRSLQDALDMIQAGATRIGTSRGIDLISGLAE